MKVVVLGANGMLGNAMMRVMADSESLDVVGTVRSEAARTRFAPTIRQRVTVAPDVLDSALDSFLESVSPDVIVNCVSPSREALRKGDPLALIPICALLPHQLAESTRRIGARLVHISTDGVFSGNKGNYDESDIPDAVDTYGLCKLLGEPRSDHVITLRVSMIGHQIGNADGLLEWFLAQQGACKCFSRAVFSGLPTVVLAQIVRDYVLPHSELSGVYHVAAQPITKCELLELIARVYGKEIELAHDDGPAIDRSLNSSRFRTATGYVAPDWPALIQTMHSFR
jgi:dTDP-4-dehydrorhamnose reductase